MKCKTDSLIARHEQCAQGMLLWHGEFACKLSAMTAYIAAVRQAALEA